MNSSEDIFRKAVDEMAIFWNESAQNIANKNAILSNRFEWLNNYCDSLFERWESYVDLCLSWAHTSKKDSSKSISEFFFPTINKVSLTIDRLKMMLPNTENVNKVLPILIAKYMISDNPKSEEEDLDPRGLVAYLKYGNGTPLSPTLRDTYSKKFYPADFMYGGLRPQKIEVLLESQALFRKALYLDIFLNAIDQCYQMGGCDIHASVDLFESRSELLKLYFGYNLNELLSLSSDSLYSKLSDALHRRLCNYYNYTVFGARLLYRLCIEKAPFSESPVALFDTYAEALNNTWLPFDPDKDLADLGYQTDFSEDYCNQTDDIDDDDIDDDDDDDDDDQEKKTIELDSSLGNCLDLIEVILNCMHAKKEGNNIDFNICITATDQVSNQINELINKLYDLGELIEADGQI